MKYLKTHTLISAAILSLSIVCHAGGDDIVKTWKNKQEAYYKGETLVEKNSVEAIQRMESLLKKYKWNKTKKVAMLHKLADLHLNTGRILENKNENIRISNHTKKALAIYKNIISQSPNYAKMEYVLFSRGFELFMRKNFEESQRVLSVLNKRFPRSKFADDSYVIRADSLFELKKYQSATNLYTKAERSPDRELAVYSKYKKSWSFFNLKKYNQAYSSLYSIAKADLKKKASKLYSSGEALADLPSFYQKQTLTKNFYNDFVTVAGKSRTEPLLSQLSDLYFEQGEWLKSIGVYKDLIGKYPRSKVRSVYHLKRGLALSTQRKITGASAEIKKGIDLCNINLCDSIIQDDVFKLVTDWEKHWRSHKKSTEYSRALAIVYPSLAINTKDKIEKSKIYFLLAEVQYHSKNFLKASYAFEKAYLENPKSNYTKQARWGSIESLVNLKSNKWNKDEVKRLAKITNFYIERFPKENNAIVGQNFLAKMYKKTNQPVLAAELFKRISEDHMYTNLGSEAYNSFLKLKVKEKNYDTITGYLLTQRSRDSRKIKQKLINADLDRSYTEWTELLLKQNYSKKLVNVYLNALKNRPDSNLRSTWQWNKSLALVSGGSHKKAAESFMVYERQYKNSEKKRLQAFNNALVSYKKVKMYDEALRTASLLHRFDRNNQDQWLLEQVSLHMIKGDFLTAFEVLTQVERSNPSKNSLFVTILKELNKEELNKVTRSNLTSFSGDSVGELLLKLISKINDIDSKATKSAALKLKGLKLEDSNYNARGNYTLAVHEFRKFKKTDFGVNSRLQKSLEKMIKKMVKIDAYYRDSIAQSTDLVQAKSLIGLGALYFQVADNYTSYAKKRLRNKKDISEIEELVQPFLGQSKVFLKEANSSLASMRRMKNSSSLKNILKRSLKKTNKLEEWYKKNTQMAVAHNKGVK